LGTEIKTKYDTLISDNFFEKNNINTYLDNGEINSTIKFFLTSKFDLEEAKKYKNKKEYLQFLELA
jgi:hypothetical protein